MGIGRRAGRILLLVAVGLGALYAFRGPLLRTFFGPQEPTDLPRGVSLADLREAGLETVAEGLRVPWEVAFAPDGGIWVTERRGRLVRLEDDWRTPEREDGVAESIVVDGVLETGEGGLMGLALHPGFPEPRWVYLAMTYEGPEGPANRVMRYRLDAAEAGGAGEVAAAGEHRLADPTVVIDGIPGASFHDGGRIAFGPSGLLHLTTGDAGRGGRARDRGSLAGKILRLDPRGAVPGGNPFGTPVWSYGHRNPQGLAWDGDGRLWSTEHGPSGLESGWDEVNLIRRGGDYGWPDFRGEESGPGTVPPVAQSGAELTWAPAGAAWHDGRLLFGGLRGEALYELRISGGDGEAAGGARRPAGAALPRATGPVVHLFGELGRIRVVRIGPDGLLYLGTSNRDGRGRPRPGDDRILRFDPAALR